jgi:hypothetical protein
MYQMQPQHYHYAQGLPHAEESQLPQVEPTEGHPSVEAHFEEVRTSEEIKSELQCSLTEGLPQKKEEMASPSPKKHQHTPSSGETESASIDTFTKAYSISPASEFKSQS